MLPNSRKKHYDILLHHNRELINMNPNHFIITKDWLQEVINFFEDKTDYSSTIPDYKPNPFKDVFFRCKAKCSHCGYTIGYILVAFFEEATIVIWDKDCDTNILTLNKFNWDLVDIDVLSSKGSTIDTIPCLPIPSIDLYPFLNEREKHLYKTSEDMLSSWFRNTIQDVSIKCPSEFTLTEEVQTFVKFLQNTNLGTPYIKSLPDGIIIRVGDTFSSNSGILFILNKKHS